MVGGLARFASENQFCSTVEYQRGIQKFNTRQSGRLLRVRPSRRRGWKKRRARSRVCFKDLRANVSTRSLYTRHESTLLPAFRDKTQGIPNGFPLQLPATLTITDPMVMRIQRRNNFVPRRFAKIVRRVVFQL